MARHRHLVADMLADPNGRPGPAMSARGTASRCRARADPDIEGGQDAAEGRAPPGGIDVLHHVGDEGRVGPVAGLRLVV